MTNQLFFMRNYGLSGTPVVIGECNSGKTFTWLSAAHCSSSTTRVYAGNTTAPFIAMDKTISTLWNCVDDSMSTKKEEIIAVSGKL